MGHDNSRDLSLLSLFYTDAKLYAWGGPVAHAHTHNMKIVLSIIKVRSA